MVSESDPPGFRVLLKVSTTDPSKVTSMEYSPNNSPVFLTVKLTVTSSPGSTVDGDTCRLLAENPDYAPIEITEDSSCEIWGVVTSSINQF